MERAANVIILVGGLCFIFVIMDTWKQARQTNQFIYRILDYVSEKEEPK
jgi:hypothetical protein